MQKILIIDYNNTYYGPTAEVILRKLIKNYNLKNIVVFSAGVVVNKGEKVPEKVLNLLKEKGLSVENFTSRQLIPEYLDNADLILTMSKEQKEIIQNIKFAHNKKIITLKEFAEEEGEIIELYEQSIAVYSAFFDEMMCLLEKSIRKIAAYFKIVIGSDHGGCKLKKEIKTFLKEINIVCKDIGCFENEIVDYPDIAAYAGQMVSRGIFQRGILICGTGIGISIAANKIKGIRAAVCNDGFSAKMSREHNNSNILCLGERVIGIGLACMITEVWLKSNFIGGRHEIRLNKISNMELR